MARNKSNECSESSDRLSDDQVLHLECAFVGIQGFAVGKETSGLVVGDDAIPAKKLAGPSDRLTALGSAERLGQRRMRVGQFAFVEELRLAHNEALRSGDIADHPGKQVLHKLE